MTDPHDKLDSREIAALAMEAEKDWGLVVDGLADGLIKLDVLRTTDFEETKEYLSEMDENFIAELSDLNFDPAARDFFVNIATWATMRADPKHGEELNGYNKFIVENGGKFNVDEGYKKYGNLMLSYGIKELIASIRAQALLVRTYNQTDPVDYIRFCTAYAVVYQAVEYGMPIPADAGEIIGAEETQGIVKEKEHGHEYDLDQRLNAPVEEQVARMEYMSSDRATKEAEEFVNNKNIFTKFMDKFNNINKLTALIAKDDHGRLPV